jgi:phytanoyl-CoA hydroxylase
MMRLATRRTFISQQVHTIAIRGAAAAASAITPAITASAPFVSRFGAFGTFTEAHYNTFQNDGIVCVPSFVPGAYADYLRASLEATVESEAARRKAEGSSQKITSFSAEGEKKNEYLSDAYFLESGDKIRYFLEPGQTEISVAALNKVAHALHTDGGVFQEFTSHQAFRSIARRLGLSQPSVVQSMYILKPPRVGTAVGAHQDSTWIHTTPLSCVAMWIALDDCTINNSCLLALKGSHKTHVPLSSKASLVNGESVLSGPLPNVPLEAMEPLECPKGSLVLFTGQTVHGSLGNLSDKQRHAYTFHMVDDSAVWSENNWFGKHLARLAL